MQVRTPREFVRRQCPASRSVGDGVFLDIRSPYACSHDHAISFSEINSCQLPRCLAVGSKATATRLYIIAQGWPTAGRPTLGITHRVTSGRAQ